MKRYLNETNMASALISDAIRTYCKVYHQINVLYALAATYPLRSKQRKMILELSNKLFDSDRGSGPQ